LACAFFRLALHPEQNLGPQQSGAGCDVQAIVEVQCHDVGEAERDRSQLDIRAYLGVESGLHRGAFAEAVGEVGTSSERQAENRHVQGQARVQVGVKAVDVAGRACGRS
jgi:hypothetical protein